MEGIGGESRWGKIFHVKRYIHKRTIAGGRKGRNLDKNHLYFLFKMLWLKKNYTSIESSSLA